MMKKTLGTFAAALMLLAAVPWWGSVIADAAESGSGIKSISDESGRDSEPNNSDDLRKEFQGLLDELKALEKDAREMIQKEVIPRIREELHKLREKLRDFGLDEDQPDTRRI